MPGRAADHSLDPPEDEIERDLLDSAAAGPAAIRGSLLRAAGYGGGVLFSVISVSLLIRHLGVADFGRYVTVISLVTIVQGVTDAGLTAIGVREYAVLKRDERARLMRNLAGIRIALTSLGGLLATAFAAAAGYGQPLVLGTLLAGAGLVLVVMAGTYSVPLSATLRLGTVTALDVLRQLLTVLAIVGLVVAGAGLLPFFALAVPVGAVVVVVTVIVVRGSMPLRPTFEGKEWLRLARIVLPYAGASALGTIYFRVTIVGMSLIASELQTGYYATSYRVLEVLEIGRAHV